MESEGDFTARGNQKNSFQWIKAGEPIYDQNNKPRKGQRRGIASSGSGLNTHPCRIGPGGLLEAFTNHPPTVAEMEELRQVQVAKQGHELVGAITKAVTARTVLRFKGNNSSKEFRDWKDALSHFFSIMGITNSAIKSWLALTTVDAKAKQWWLAQQALKPKIVVSFEQLMEWIRHELVPTSVPAESIKKWCSLAHTSGDLEEYFREVEELDMYHPQPPDVSQYLAARPFGHALINKLQAVDAAQNYTGLTPVQWQDIVRQHVLEEEQKDTFRSWSSMGIDPVHKNAPKLRQVTTSQFPSMVGSFADASTMTTEEAMMLVGLGDDAPPTGYTDEEWTAKLNQSLTVTGNRPARIGKGEKPCFCCGADDHSWIHCNHKKRGNCAVCGALDHRTRQCYNRFQPHPNLRQSFTNQQKPLVSQPKTAPQNSLASRPFHGAPNTQNPTKTPFQSSAQAQQGLQAARKPFTPNQIQRNTPQQNPTLRQVQAMQQEESESEDEEKDVSQTMVGMGAQEKEGAEPEQEEEAEEDVVENNPSLQLLQAQVLAHLDDEAPAWARQRGIMGGHREKVGRPLFPCKDPDDVGQIVYPAKVNGHSAKMLYDPGASHSFIDLQWAVKAGLRVHPIQRKTTLQHFSGSTEGAIRGYCLTKDFEVAGKTFEWRFYVISPAPNDVILGLDFLVKYQPVVEMGTFAFWNTEVKPEVGMEEQSKDNDKDSEEIEDVPLSCINVVDPRCAFLCSTVHFPAFHSSPRRPAEPSQPLAASATKTQNLPSRLNIPDLGIFDQQAPRLNFPDLGKFSHEGPMSLSLSPSAAESPKVASTPLEPFNDQGTLLDSRKVCDVAVGKGGDNATSHRADRASTSFPPSEPNFPKSGKFSHGATNHHKASSSASATSSSPPSTYSLPRQRHALPLLRHREFMGGRTSTEGNARRNASRIEGFGQQTWQGIFTT